MGKCETSPVKMVFRLDSFHKHYYFDGAAYPHVAKRGSELSWFNLHKCRTCAFALFFLSFFGCSGVWEIHEAPETPVVVAHSRPRGTPIGKRVYRRPGRLGPDGGLLGYQQRYTYPEVPTVYHPEVRRFVTYYGKSRRSFIEEANERRARYLPVMKEVFNRYGLPAELLNLAHIESRFIPTARSRDGSTVGLWQLSRATARNYGLKVVGQVDERTDVRKSTEAAARFLASLFDTFGDWYLAAAAYNSGPARVQRAVDKVGMVDPMDTLDVFQLTSQGALSVTTREFVAKFGALVIIMKDPEKYGF